jgi:hypothetical protein
MLKHESIDQIQAGWDEFERPADGEQYRHYKGGEYEIVATGFFESTTTPCVIYRSVEDHVTWVRSARNFLEALEYDGETVPRFSKI